MRFFWLKLFNVDAEQLTAGYRLLYETLRVACFFAGVRAADAKGKKKCLTELYTLWGTCWSWGTAWS